MSPIGRLLTIGLAALLGLSAFALADDESELQRALGDDEVGDKWIYDDLDAGFAEAKATGKPLLVVFR